MADDRIVEKRMKILDTFLIAWLEKLCFGELSLVPPNEIGPIMSSMSFAYKNGEIFSIEKNYFNAVKVSVPDNNGSTLAYLSAFCFNVGIEFLKSCLFVSAAPDNEIEAINEEDAESLVSFVENDTTDYSKIGEELKSIGLEYTKHSQLDCLEDILEEAFDVIQEELDTKYQKEEINEYLIDAAFEVSASSYLTLIV